jgi:site-specific recombinase XerD
VSGLAVVRSLGLPRRLGTAAEAEDFEQELVDQWLLAMVGAGCVDSHVRGERATIVEFVRFCGRRLWEVTPADADRYLRSAREQGLARATVQDKAWAVARFYEFLLARHAGDIHTATGHLLVQPIDEFNRPARVDTQAGGRVPPPDEDVRALFEAWSAALPSARKYLPAARDYLAASLWRRVGLRINETAMLDIRDWRPDLGEAGKLHVRYGKGSQGRGPKTRLVPGINSADALLTWWLTDVRHQFGDDWQDPDAPLLPSERRDPLTGRCQRVGADALRSGLTAAISRWLPAWEGRLTPHGLRHYCASHLYSKGVDLKAIQELLGHSWLSTTTRYVHVHEDHIEQAWAQANQRVTTRLTRR